MKTLLSFLVVIALTNITIAQTSAIPDLKFEQYLIAMGLDTGMPDGSVLTANIDTVTILNIPGLGINDLTGIEDFTSLIHLDCGSYAPTPFFTQYNYLTNLNLTQNTSLTFLKCNNNNLTNLDVSQNNDLTHLECNVNGISNLDITHNPLLTYLNCIGNLLTSLNISQNTNLFVLACSYNQLNCLNGKNGNNNNFTLFHAIQNPYLTCIEVDDVGYSTTNWTFIDSQTSFSNNCPNPCPVGINENNLSNISIYPNPTSGNISINFGEVKQNLKATLTNSLGQVIFAQQFESTDHFKVDIDAPTGIYFLKIESSDGETKTIKVLKN